MAMDKSITLEELQSRANEIAEDVATTGAVYHVVRAGSPKHLVVLDEDTFSGWLHAIDEMRRPGFAEEYAETSLELQAGAGHDLEHVKETLLGDRSA